MNISNWTEYPKNNWSNHESVNSNKIIYSMYCQVFFDANFLSSTEKEQLRMEIVCKGKKESYFSIPEIHLETPLHSSPAWGLPNGWTSSYFWQHPDWRTATAGKGNDLAGTELLVSSPCCKRRSSNSHGTKNIRSTQALQLTGCEKTKRPQDPPAARNSESWLGKNAYQSSHLFKPFRC